MTEQPVQGIECPAGTERLSVRLNWDSYSDIDLIIYEPNSNRVGPNINGDYGVSYVDSLVGKGHIGELYETKCDKNILGEFIVGLTYFSGEGPTTANVRIQMKDEVIEREVYLVAPLPGLKTLLNVVGTVRVIEQNSTINYEFVPYPLCQDSVEVFVTWNNSDTLMNLYVEEPNGDNVYYDNV